MSTSLSYCKEQSVCIVSVNEIYLKNTVNVF